MRPRLQESIRFTSLHVLLTACAVLGLCFLTAGCSSKDGADAKGSSTKGGESAKAPSTEEAKKRLLETAEKFEGPFARAVKETVDSVESGRWPISMADDEMSESRPGQHKFSRETREAYQVWRKAYLAEKKK